MPGCSSHKIRHLYFEDTVKLKDSQSNKIDVHCFLFTDIFLVCKALNKKSSDSKMKVIRQPFITDRLIIRELKDASGFLMIYLNELNVASTFLLLYTSEAKTWVDTIKKAQEDYRNLKYSSEQEFNTYHAHFDAEAFETDHGLLGTSSPRSSSRSSLIHSHSGSQDMTDQPTYHYGQLINNNQLAIQSQPPRAISFELGDLRNPSLVVEDAESFARSQSVDNRSPVVTITSPRPERRAFLLRNSNGKNSSSSNLSSGGSSPSNSLTFLNQNNLSVSVPCGQTNLLPVQPLPVPRSGRRSGMTSPNSSASASSLSESCSGKATIASGYISPASLHSSTFQVAVHPPPSPPSPPIPPSLPKRSVNHRPVSGGALTSAITPPHQSSLPPPPSPPSLMSISSRMQTGPFTMTINKPPLVKTKNVSCGIASMSYTTDKASDSRSESSIDCSQCEQLKVNFQSDNSCDSEYSLDQQKEQPMIEGNEEFYNFHLAQQSKRSCRPDRRYHTADSIEHLKKEKDNSIHKRLSWNYGQQQHLPCNHQATCSHFSNPNQSTSSNQLHLPRLLPSSHHHKCLSNESMYSSSGISSTGSVTLSVGSMENNCEHICSCCNHELKESHFDEQEEEDQTSDSTHNAVQQSVSNQIYNDRDSALANSPALNPDVSLYNHTYSHFQCNSDNSLIDKSSLPCTPSQSLKYARTQQRPSSSDVKIDVSEVKDGISSVQITLTGGLNSVTRPSKADLKKMKEFLLSNCNVESS